MIENGDKQGMHSGHGDGAPKVWSEFLPCDVEVLCDVCCCQDGWGGSVSLGYALGYFFEIMFNLMSIVWHEFVWVLVVVPPLNELVYGVFAIVCECEG